MNHSVWQLDPARYRASLHSDQVSAQILLDQPQAGWQGLQYQGQSQGFAPVQVCLEPASEPSATPPATMHVRGTDVIATYPATGQREFTTQIYRGVERKAGPHSLLVMSTLVSLNTHLLDARPEITLRTERPAGSELLQGTEAGFVPAAEKSPSEASTMALVLRTTAGEQSYVELWHASDFRTFEAGETNWVHSFAEPLEKGVIRRLLIWSAFVPRDSDLELAADLQQQFLETAPPLST